jgi:hypothetical protein
MPLTLVWCRSVKSFLPASTLSITAQTTTAHTARSTAEFQHSVALPPGTFALDAIHHFKASVIEIKIMQHELIQMGIAAYLPAKIGPDANKPLLALPRACGSMACALECGPGCCGPCQLYEITLIWQPGQESVCTRSTYHIWDTNGGERPGLQSSHNPYQAFRD